MGGYLTTNRILVCRIDHAPVQVPRPRRDPDRLSYPDLVLPSRLLSQEAGTLQRSDEPSRLRAAASREVHISTPLAFISTKLSSQGRCGNSWTGSSVMPFPGSRFPIPGCRPLGGADGGTRATRAPWSTKYSIRSSTITTLA